MRAMIVWVFGGDRPTVRKAPNKRYHTIRFDVCSRVVVYNCVTCTAEEVPTGGGLRIDADSFVYPVRIIHFDRDPTRAGPIASN